MTELIKIFQASNIQAGNTEFKRSEMMSIKAIFPDCSMDYLFSTEEV